MKQHSTRNLVSFSTFGTPDVLDEFDEFENDATRDDRVAICGFPVYARRALDAFRIRRTRKRSKEDAIAFAVCCGIPELRRFEGRLALSAARDTLLHSTSGDIAMVDVWPYQLNAHNWGRERKVWARISEAHVKECAKLAAQIGVTHSCMAGLAIFATLMRAPNVPATLRGFMKAELVNFGRQLRDRAKSASVLVQGARMDQPCPEYSFDEVLAEVESGQLANQGRVSQKKGQTRPRGVDSGRSGEVGNRRRRR